MTNQDSLQRFIFEKAPVRGEYIRLQTSFQDIINQHDYPPPIRHLLGESLCVAGLLSAIIKFKGRLTVQFRGKGKLKLLLAQCDNQFHIRGLAKWEGQLTYEDLMESFKQGVLLITLDSGPGKRYQGIVAWRGNSLAESIEGYFQDSEQLATKIWLAVDDTKAAGFLLQVIPGVQKDVKGVEDEIISPHWARISQLTASLRPEDILMSDHQALLNKLYPEEEIRIFPSDQVSFNCTCSRKRGEDAILILGREEAEAELKNNNSIVVTCDFCNKEYVFDRVDVIRIFEDRGKPSSQTQIH
ncbi:33 kDa chaperonin [Aquicella siphonis]|uniref:33 kDa chaperonin n=1 Tax=Aquicella siphonis TaxID=254247 RepID=A0A5E4PHU0_9COXI|nr:Hsp33 family molecular chaperone HslO [Aquicella siphonis]VVC75896.1 33 kDa chaperonin [Aquicella siphonis]